MADISTSAIAAVADRGGVLDPTAEVREPEYRAIAELMPQLVWAALPDGGTATTTGGCSSWRTRSTWS